MIIGSILLINLNCCSRTLYKNEKWISSVELPPLPWTYFILNWVFSPGAGETSTRQHALMKVRRWESSQSFGSGSSVFHGPFCRLISLPKVCCNYKRRWQQHESRLIYSASQTEAAAEWQECVALPLRDDSGRPETAANKQLTFAE